MNTIKRALKLTTKIISEKLEIGYPIEEFYFDLPYMLWVYIDKTPYSIKFKPEVIENLTSEDVAYYSKMFEEDIMFRLQEDLTLESVTQVGDYEYDFNLRGFPMIRKGLEKLNLDHEYKIFPLIIITNLNKEPIDLNNLPKELVNSIKENFDSFYKSLSEIDHPELSKIVDIKKL